MMTANMFGELMGTLWWLFPVPVILAILTTPWFKAKTFRLLSPIFYRRFLPPQIYHVLSHVELNGVFGRLRVPQILVSRYGVFVVQTLNQGGELKGDIAADDWRACRWRKVYGFRNPMIINDICVKTLVDDYYLPADCVHPVVFFRSDTDVSGMPENVTQGLGFFRYLRTFRDVVLTERQVADIVDILQAEREPARDLTDRSGRASVDAPVRERPSQLEEPVA